MAKIIHKKSAVSSKIPLVSDLDYGELAINYADGRLYYKTSTNTITHITAGLLTGNQAITISGDASGSGATSIALTLANSGVTAGTYTKLTVDAKGRVTSGTTLSASDIPTLNQNTTGTASNVTGTVAIANGGTGATTLLANAILVGSGTNPVQSIAPGAAGNTLVSNGTTWNSQPAQTGAQDYILMEMGII